LQYTCRAVCIFVSKGKEWIKVGEQRVERKAKTNLAKLVRLANVDERPPPTLVLFAAHDGMHRADRAVERNQGAGLALSRFGLHG
jgi:hypothetical protein